MLRLTARFAIVLSSFASAALAQQRSDTSWSVEATHGPARQFKSTVDEGTWISLDVSPDGRTVVFDLLGDLFSIPIEGGTATRLTSSRAWDATPRFSPDGRRVVFVSDRSGSEQLWTIDASGANAKQITRDATSQYDFPIWTPDGDYVIAMKKSHVGDGTPDTYVMLHTSGGTGVKIGNAGIGPTLSHDGRWLYYADAVGSRFQTQVFRIDRTTGERAVIVAGYDDASRPQASRTGRYLAFIATIDGKRCLIVRELEGGADRVLYRGMDQLEAWNSDDLDEAPGYAFTPNDGAIVFAAGGKIRRVDIASGAASVIPFRATLDNTLTERIYVRGRVPDGALSPKVLHWAQPAGAGRLVFGAAGRIYLYDVASKRATPFAASGEALEYAPAVSPDGKWIAFIQWADTLGGMVLKQSIAGGPITLLTSRTGRYHSVAWSPDGKRLVIAEERGNPDYMSTIGYDLLVIDADKQNAPRRVWDPLESTCRHASLSIL